LDEVIVYSRKSPFLQVVMIPISKNPNSGKLEKLVGFEIHISYFSNRPDIITKKSPKYASHSVLVSGQWFKIGIANTGIHKLTYLYRMRVRNQKGDFAEKLEKLVILK